MRRLFLSIVLVSIGCFAAFARAEDGFPDQLEKARERGTLEVSVYRDYPPYSYEVKGQYTGIDVDLAAALAQELGLKLTLRPFIAGEDLDDDLRNQVWRGSLLGGGVGDVMMHVGADPEYIRRQSKVSIFGIYLHESIVLALRPNRFKTFVSMEQLKDKKTGVELGSISDLYLSDVYGGSLRESVARFPTASAAVKAFIDDEIDALMLPRGEMQGLTTLQGGAAFKASEVTFKGLFRNKWDIGVAVKTGSPALKTALQTALTALMSNGKLAEIYARYGLDYALVGAANAE
jgi:polar amino acid transport system substrate-binding protein